MNQGEALKTHYLYPGELFAHREPHVVTTVLGSCISVCLWEPVARLGGMNHYLLPLWNGDGLPTPKYGNIAIPRLVEKLVGLGAAEHKLQAKVFGGAAMWNMAEGLLAVGLRNIQLAEHALRELGIPVLGSDLGGSQSRKIIFNTGDGSVLLRRHGAPQRQGS